MIHRSRYAMPAIPAVGLPGFLLEHAAARGDHPALVDDVGDRLLTYAQLGAAVGDVVASLRARGIGPGDTVALVGANHPDWAAALLGIMASGAAAVPLNPALTEGELTGYYALARTALVVRGPGATGSTDPGRVPVVGWDSLLGSGASDVDADPVAPAPASPAVIVFSSGTTGQPKGVVLTHRNLVATILQHEAIYRVGPSDRFLAVLPFFHVYGLSMVLGYGLRHGATIVTAPRFDLSRYLALIERHRITRLHVAPPILLRMASATVDADFSSVRHVVSGAAPLDAGVAARSGAQIGAQVGQGYGMTEASPGVTWVPDVDDGATDEACPAGSVGVLVAGTEARLVDPATGNYTDGPGELWVRGPQIMAGYLDDLSATAQTIVEDGWLRTGDIARVDDDGVWWIVDRLKELIKYNGFQVAPAELEAVLLGHPAVTDAAVAGLPDASAGEIPKAWVVAAGPLEADELMAWVAERVASYKKVRAVEFVAAIPRSPAGKILRRQLRETGAGV